MLNYRLDPAVTNAVAHSIFLTGSTRSGTSMMGELFLSFSDFELFHEPPFTYLFLPLINDVDEQLWRIVFETYLFEDNQMLAIPGRKLNFNRGDDSSVYRGKTEEDLAARTARTMRRTEILPIALDRQFCFKMPEMLPFLPKLRSYYPDMTTVVMLRKPEGVVASILAKGWYSDDALSNVTGEWLFRRDTELRIPYWVPEDFVSRWTEMSELERCCFCYSHQYKHIVGRTDCLIVDYDDFLTDPNPKFATLTKLLECRFGPKTEELLAGVAETRRDRNLPFDFAGKEFVEPMFDTYHACRKLAVNL